MAPSYYFQEAFQHMREHKLRSTLTGFGIMWGIFLLVVLLGAGDGFHAGVRRRMQGLAQNAVFFVTQRTESGQQLHLNDQDLEQLRYHFPEVAAIVPVVQRKGDSPLRYGHHTYKTDLYATTCDAEQVDGLVLADGRYFTARDMHEKRSVCVLGHSVYEGLFDTNISPLGKYVNLDGQWLQVVGILDANTASNRQHQQKIMLPLPTFRRLYGRGFEVYFVKLLLASSVSPKAFEQRLRTYLSQKLGFDLSDKKAITCWNIAAEHERIRQLFTSIKTFLWLVSISLLLSSLVGVSNMMLVTVKERTQEMAIRKVMGARNRQILLLILCESWCVTLGAGLVGMVSGIGLLHLGNWLLAYVDPHQTSMMAAMHFHDRTAFVALGLLTGVGTAAGMWPALRAMRIRPHKALSAL